MRKESNQAQVQRDTWNVSSRTENHGRNQVCSTGPGEPPRRVRTKISIERMETENEEFHNHQSKFWIKFSCDYPLVSKFCDLSTLPLRQSHDILVHKSVPVAICRTVTIPNCPTSGTSPVFTSKPVRVRDLQWNDHLRERVKNILPRLSFSPIFFFQRPCNLGVDLQTKDGYTPFHVETE